MIPSSSSSYSKVPLMEDKVETDEFEIWVLGSPKGTGITFSHILCAKNPKALLPCNMPYRMVCGIVLRAKAIHDDCSRETIFRAFATLALGGSFLTLMSFANNVPKSDLYSILLCAIAVAEIVCLVLFAISQRNLLRRREQSIVDLVEKEIVKELEEYIRTEWGYQLSLQVDQHSSLLGSRKSCSILLTRLFPKQTHLHCTPPPLWQAEESVDGEITLDVQPQLPWNSSVEPRALQGHSSVDSFSWAEMFCVLNKTTTTYFYGVNFAIAHLLYMGSNLAWIWFSLMSTRHSRGGWTIPPGLWLLLINAIDLIVYYSLVYGRMHVLRNDLEAVSETTLNPLLQKRCGYGVEYKTVPGRFFGSTCQLRLFPTHDGFRQDRLEKGPEALAHGEDLREEAAGMLR